MRSADEASAARGGRRAPAPGEVPQASAPGLRGARDAREGLEGRRAHDGRAAGGAADSGFGAWGDWSRSLPDGLVSGLTPLDALDDSRFLARAALKVMASDEGAALPRVLRTYVVARSAIGLALLAAPLATVLAGSPVSWAVVVVSLLYALQALFYWGRRLGEDLPRQLAHRLQRRQWLWTVGVDVVAFSLLRLLEPQQQLNYAALLVLPVLMSGVLTRRRIALGTSAVAVLVLLAGVLLDGHGLSDGAMVALSQAGLAGAGLFAIALLSNELAQRLAGEERSARKHLALARQQSQLNRLVIAEMSDGVLVVDHGLQVRAANPAALVLLGTSADRLLHQTLSDLPGLRALQHALQQAFEQGCWPDAAHELTLQLPDAERRTVRVRARFPQASPGAAEPSEALCVLFLEDARAVQARLRQDKLAAMGRMSAGIAHELRNPLAAVAQANALMMEDPLPPTQQRLAAIVADNVQRLKRIVDDVLTVASLPAGVPTVIDLLPAVQQICADWQRSAAPEWRVAQRLQLSLPDARPQAHFDAEHLRRVLVNLLDNAMRHASQGEGAVQLRLRLLAGIAAAELTVASDGEPIPPQTERHLFEPFFSTRSRGSGLGLYICRELCARHGASIDFEPAPPGQRHRNLFVIGLRLLRPVAARAAAS